MLRISYYIPFALILLNLLPNLIEAQVIQYGNEWYSPNQDYIKLIGDSEGIYRVTANDLVPFGIPLNIPPKKLHLIFQGKEQPMWVQDQNGNNLFDGTDFIEYAGQGNDGSLDKFLYRNPTNGRADSTGQPNPYKSLFTDSAAYFLTWNTIDGLRYQNYFNNNYSTYQPEEYFKSEHLLSFEKNYNKGADGEAYFLNSDYGPGEGFTEFASFGLSDPPRMYWVPTPGLYTSLTNTIRAEIRIFGISNTPHTIQTTINTILRDTLESSGIQVKSFALDYPSDPVFPDSSFFVFQPLNFNNPNNTDNNFLAFIKLSYNRKTDLQGKKEASFIDWNKNSEAFFQFTNCNANPGGESVILDYTTLTRSRGSTTNSGEVRVIIPGDSTKRKMYFAHDGSFKTPIIKASSLNNLGKQDGVKMIIISSRQLSNSAEAFAQYKSVQSPVNRISAKVFYTDEIYDEYGNGTITPLAIKRFFRQAIEQWDTVPEFAVIWGKGWYITWKDVNGHKELIPENLVPAYGYPSSDILYVCNFSDSIRNYIPAISIGRINATSDTEGFAYLNKVKDYELSNYDGSWMKQAVHLGGGSTAAEQNAIGTFLQNQFEPLYEGVPNGGHVTYHQKTSNQVSGNAAQLIEDRINNGAQLITFFGHSSSNLFDVLIEEPSVYTNYGKYPFMIANGCYGGDFSSPAKSFGERFVLEPGKGCIGYLSSTSTGYLYVLGNYSRTFYQTAFTDSIGKPLGNIHKKTISQFLGPNYQNAGTQLNFNHALQILLQGDPSISLYNTNLPDYLVLADEIRFLPSDFSSKDTFTIAVTARNNGRAFSDSIDLGITQIPLDGPNQNVPLILPKVRIKSPRFSDTISVKIAPQTFEIAGLNRFKIKIDCSDEKNESNEQNNEVTLDRIISGNVPATIYPPPFAIVDTNRIYLSAGLYSNTNDPGIGYEFELDTTYNFSSPFRINSGLITGTSSFAKWNIPISLIDSMVYFWRVKMTGNPVNAWASSSFRYLPGKTGWTQAKPEQFYNNTFEGLSTTIQDSIWHFDLFTADFQVYTYDMQTFGWAGFNLNGNNVSLVNSQGLQGILVTPIDKRTLLPLTDDPDTGPWEWISTPADLQRLIDIIQQMDTGNYFLLTTQRNAFMGDWALNALGESAYQALESVGASVCRTIENGEAYVLLGRKGPYSAIEITTKDTLTNRYTLETTLSARRSIGKFQTPLIGPVGSAGWNLVRWERSKVESSDLDTCSFIFRTASETDSFFSFLPSGTDISIPPSSGIPAPYSYMEVAAEDSINGSPIQTSLLQVIFPIAPDLGLDPGSKFSITAGPYAEGQPITASILARNLGEPVPDSVKAWVFLENVNGNRVQLAQMVVPPFGSNDTITLNFNFKIPDLEGNNFLTFELNPENRPQEQYRFNNVYRKLIKVSTDKINPVVSITFDGRNIMDQEIVSSKPEIAIQVKDENKYLVLDSLSLFRVRLKLPNGSDSLIVLENNPSVLFQPGTLPTNKAILFFHPGPLINGLYSLEVQTFDKKGNPSGNEPYSIRFRVVNEETITPVYNYPNPFSSNTRFVFTLTGSDLPDIFRIDIYTITGKQIKYFDLASTGELHIGNNITTSFWDGTDAFGDKVANGVYLYKVTVKRSGKTYFSNEETGSDYFSNGFGKMYLMR
jgi:hypothetical protein